MISQDKSHKSENKKEAWKTKKEPKSKKDKDQKKGEEKPERREGGDLLHVASTPHMCYVRLCFLKCRAMQQVAKAEKKRARSGARKHCFRVA